MKNNKENLPKLTLVIFKPNYQKEELMSMLKLAANVDYYCLIHNLNVIEFSFAANLNDAAKQIKAARRYAPIEAVVLANVRELTDKAAEFKRFRSYWYDAEGLDVYAYH